MCLPLMGGHRCLLLDGRRPFVTDLQQEPLQAPSMDAPRAVDLREVWKSIVWRGFAAVLFGVITFLIPGLTLKVLVLLFGAYALVDGILNVANVIRKRTGKERWWAMLLQGLASIAAAVITAVRPAVTALALVYLVGAWAFITGIFEIVTAIRMRRVIKGEWLLALGGLLSVVFGVLLFRAPAMGALALTLWIGAYAFIFGVLMIALGFRLRREADHGHPSGPQIGVPA